MGEFSIAASISVLQLDLAGADVKMSVAPLTMEPPRNQCRGDWDVTKGCHSGWDPRRKRIAANSIW